MTLVATLLTPFRYLQVKHPLKRLVDWVSLGSGAATGLLVALCVPKFNFFGFSGLVLGFNGLLQSLVGFFITALAAVATFQGTVFKLDKFFDGEQVTLHEQQMTRRQFLCYLFGYLALNCLSTYLISVILIAMVNSPDLRITGAAHTGIRGVFVILYLANMSHLFGTTLIGLVFLTERLASVADGDLYTVKGIEPKPYKPALDADKDDKGKNSATR